MLARRLEQPADAGLRLQWASPMSGRRDRRARESTQAGEGTRGADAGDAGRWRSAGLRPSKGPHGEVQWWERPAPGGDERLWAAVVRVHERMKSQGMSVTELARRVTDAGRPIRRETLSKVLNGFQPTSWGTVEALAHILDVDVSDLRRRR